MLTKNEDPIKSA